MSATFGMKYIRDFYSVPAKTGGLVKFEGKPGVIIGTTGPRLRIRLDGEEYAGHYHPTYHLEYLSEEAP